VRRGAGWCPRVLLRRCPTSARVRGEAPSDQHDEEAGEEDAGKLRVVGRKLGSATTWCQSPQARTVQALDRGKEHSAGSDDRNATDGRPGEVWQEIVIRIGVVAVRRRSWQLTRHGGPRFRG
jgi:hypothetical protein